MSTRARWTRWAVVGALAVAVVPGAATPAGAKGTPSTVTATCGAGVAKATVTVQLVDAVATNKPASKTITLACGPQSVSGQLSVTTTLKATTSPAAAYAWSVFATTATGTSGCGGQAPRGTSVGCSGVTVLAT